MFDEPLPTAIQGEFVFPFHDAAYPVSEKIVLPVTPVHVIPSVEYAMLFAPSPSATVTHGVVYLAMDLKVTVAEVVVIAS